MEIISRAQYASQVDFWLGKGVIIVLTGQRRVGKSYILRDFIERHSLDSAANIIFLDKEKREYDSIKTYKDLDAFIGERFKADCHNYILVDEVQEIQAFEKSLRSWRTEERTDIIVTGSNAGMLSGDLATLLAGRYKGIHVQGLSYSEFRVFHGLEDSDETLRKYLEYGGLPGLRDVGLENEEHVWQYLQAILNTVVLKDIIERHDIRNLPFLNNLLRFYADNIGRLNSASSISKFMKHQGEEVSTNVVLSYAAYYEEAFLLDIVHRYDIHGKKLLESNDKVYFGDIGLRNLIAGNNREQDIEKIIENIVYQHLLRIGFKVSVGQLRAGEVDFVCEKPGKRVYVQASYLIGNDATRDREFGNLARIGDNYPKFVISLSPLLEDRDYEGILHISLRKFLRDGI